MSITLWQALALGLMCGVWKSCICYTVGGFNINTVIFNAVFVGLIMGDMYDAMVIGAAIQMIYLGVVASGGNQPADPCLATYIAIPIAIATGMDTGAAIALAVPAGLLGAQITNLVYMINGFFVQKADESANGGNTRGIALWGIYIPFVVRVLLITIPVGMAIYFGADALSGMMDNIPAWLTSGLSAMGHCLPAVGFAIITNLIAKPKYTILFFGGFLLVQYAHISTIPLLFIGVALTYLFIMINNSGKATATEDEDDEDDEEEDELPSDGARVLSSRDLFHIWTRWMVWCEVCHSFVRMMAPSFCNAMVPALNKFYPEKGDDPRYREALQRHMTFFNTEGHIGGGTCLGLSLAMEEAKSKNYDAIPGDAIMDVKTGLMGPMAGIGDTITWITLMYLFIGLFLPLAQQGNIMGGIGPVLCLTAVAFPLGFYLTKKCYEIGYSFVEKMMSSGVFDVVIMAATILGLFMMGGLAATYVTVSTPISWTVAGNTTTLKSILDAIVPGILPLVTVLLVWQYLKKHRNYFMAAVLVTVISLVLGALGVII